VGEERDEPVARGRGTRPPSRRVVTVVVAVLITFTVAATLANVFLAPLRREHPLIVLLLDARNRQLILVSNRMDALAFILVGAARRMASDPLYYLLGYWYGERAVRWMETTLGSGGSVVRTVERIFSKAAPVMVFLFPGAPVCVLAGASGMSPVVFAACNAAGTLSIVVGLRVFSHVLSEPIESLTSFVDNNAKWLALAAAVSTVILLLQQRRTGTGELQALTDLAHEVSEDDQPGGGESDGGEESAGEPTDAGTSPDRRSDRDAG
jgi:membrane protein DedA with SNARE-associated domain